MAHQQPPVLFTGAVTFGGVTYMVWGTRIGQLNFSPCCGGVILHNEELFAIVGHLRQDGGGGGGDGGGGNGGGGGDGGGGNAATATTAESVAP